MVLAAVAAVVRWGGLEITVPWADPPDAGHDPDEAGPALPRRVLWWAGLVILTALVAGIPVAGAGGRLVMRLLAATSNDAAQGRVTEADEIVGRITFGGSFGFVIFAGVFSGVMASAGYFLVRRWLPAGRVGGLVLGAGFLLVGATRIEPLRADNPDFTLVGPAGVAVAAFGALVVLQGLVVVAVAGRLSRSLPVVARRPGAVAPYLPVALLALSGPPFLLGAIVAVVIAAMSRRPHVVTRWRSSTVETLGRIALLAGVALAAPGAISAIGDIAG